MTGTAVQSRDRIGRFAPNRHTEPNRMLRSTAVQFCSDHPGVTPADDEVALRGSMDDVPVRVGVRDDNSSYVFKAGQCHALALALNERTGWPIVSVGPSECVCDEHDDDSAGVCACQVSHLAVRSPDGDLVDIDGPVPEEDFLQAHDPDNDSVRQLADDRLGKILYGDDPWLPPDMATARGFVDVSLEPIPYE